MEATPDLTILYGSQTGNAEDMAKRIGLQAKLLNLSTLVESMDDFPLKQLPRQKLIMFVCSTTGHGQEPENMKNLYQFMRRRDLPSDCLSRLKFAVYGLGDSSYAKFNYVSKILYKRLKECGAQPIQDLVASDEQHQYGCDGIIYPKLLELWPKICDTDNELLGVNLINTRSSYEATFYPKDYQQSSLPTDVFTQEFTRKYNLKDAVCIQNKRLTPESHFQDTRHLRFRTEQVLDYKPGDVCTIYPTNSDENVSLFIELLKLDPDQRFKLDKLDKNYMINYLYDFVPDGLSIQELVKHYLDIQSVPKRSFFEFLWPFSEDQLEQDKLREFASTEGQEEVYEYCIRPKRSILEVLLDFPHTVENIKFNYLFDLIPPIKPRSFSIASASSVHPNEVHLIVGVVRYKTQLKKERQGLCSNYLARLVAADESGLAEAATSLSRLKFFIRSTTFKLPSDPTTPIIMVGPGLGIAPFRSFIEERAKCLEDKQEDDDIGTTATKAIQAKNYLYFGCRFSDKDYYFQDELQDYVARNVISRLGVAFSREQPKCYVQDLLRADAKLIRELMQEDNHTNLYVAGNSRLPEDIRTLLGKILSSEFGDSINSSSSSSGGGGGSVSDGDRLVNQLEATNRIQYDCW